MNYSKIYFQITRHSTMDIDRLRSVCKSLLQITEDIKWNNDLCFSIGGKLFCVVSLNDPLTVSFKVPDEEFEELSSRIGFIPAPYLARAKWVQVTNSATLKTNEWVAFIEQSYTLVVAKLSKKVKKELGI